MNVLAIVIACGKEEQVSSGTDTAFLTLGDRPVLAHSLMTLQHSSAVDGVIVVVGKDRAESALQLIKRFGCTKVVGIVVGSTNRMATLRAVYAKMPEPASTIIIQEASRPFVTTDVIEEVLKASKRYGCAVAGHRVPDAVKVVSSGRKPDHTLERNSVWLAQSPQAFRIEVFEKIIAPSQGSRKLVDDESQWVKKPAEVHLVEAGSGNFKIRNPEDFSRATALCRARQNR